MSDGYYDVAYVWDEVHILWFENQEIKRSRRMTVEEFRKWEALTARQEADQTKMLRSFVEGNEA